jgi:integrase/recombinase XerD
MEIINLFKSYLATSGLKDITKRRYTYHIFNYLKHAGSKIENITLESARDFLIYLTDEKKLSKGTVNDYRSAIKYLFEVVLDIGWNDRKIAYLKGYKPLPVVLEKKEQIAVLEQVENILYRTMLTTIYSSGLRIQEAINLRISDINSKRMQIYIRESKNGHARYAILSEKNLELLRTYLELHPLKKQGKWQGEDYLFCSKSREKPVCIKTLRGELKKAVSKLGITKKITVHSLRHGFATHSLEEGTDIYTIKKLLGHRSISSTCVYLHILDERYFGGKSPFDS